MHPALTGTQPATRTHVPGGETPTVMMDPRRLQPDPDAPEGVDAAVPDDPRADLPADAPETLDALAAEGDDAPDAADDAALSDLPDDLVGDRDMGALIAEGKLARFREQGYATYDDILAALPTPEQSIEATDQLITYLGEQGVRVFDSAVAPDPKSGKPTPVETDTDLPGVSIDDPVRMYLREIGRVPLLSSEEEQELARRMEMGVYLVRQERELRDRLGLAPTAGLLVCTLYEDLVAN